MRHLSEFWAAQWARKHPPRTVYVGSHEDKLSRLSAMRIDPDDDGRTREDVARQRSEGRGLYGGGLTSRLAADRTRPD
jgi:hypothetical protein